MSLVIHVEPVPLRLDSSGTVRIGDSRVTLDTLIERFRCGDAPEGLAQSFPTISLADIYSVIGYYLRHRDEVDTYMRRQADQADDLRMRYPNRFVDGSTLRERLTARHTEGAIHDDSLPHG